MTNTHINVGGHKITTNKVGTVHTVPLAYASTGELNYTVTNGWCVVTTPSAITTGNTSSEKTVAVNLPKAKVRCWGRDAIGNGYFINANSTTVYGSISTTGTVNWTLIYPVADDWVES